jgi:hypothetical protein
MVAKACKCRFETKGSLEACMVAKMCKCRFGTGGMSD